MPTMEQVVLYDGEVRITLEPNHRDAVLTISREDELCFPISKANLAGILEGETMQFSHKGIFCKLARNSDDVRVVFAWKGVHDSALCPASELERLYEHLKDRQPVGS